MRGPKLTQLIETNALSLPRNTRLEDFEVLYTLALRARGVTKEASITPIDEELVLGFLCRIVLPGKKPEFKHGVCALLARYAGVAQSESLQARFVSQLSPRFTTARSAENLPVARIAGFLKHR
jgi:hypothetical protein